MHALPQRQRFLAFPLLLLMLASVIGLLFGTVSNAPSHAPVVAASHAPVSHAKKIVVETCHVNSLKQVSTIVLRCTHEATGLMWKYVTTAHIWHVWYVHHLAHLRYLHDTHRT
jgi:hypothetical protein